MESMNTAFDVIVIILSSFLFIFLVLSIVATVLVVKLVSTLRAVAAKGEHLVDSAEEIGEALKRNAGAVGLVRMLLKFINKVK